MSIFLGVYNFVSVIVFVFSLGGLILDYTLTYDGIAAFQPVINGKEINCFFVLYSLYFK